jgi:hypothetical protein
MRGVKRAILEMFWRNTQRNVALHIVLESDQMNVR